MLILAEIHKIQKYMERDQNFYHQFQRLDDLIASLPFDEEVSAEQKKEAFYSLVDLLVKKSVYKNDGSIHKWRENTIQYLREVANFLEEEDLEQVLSNQELFFDRFIFTPCGANTSIYATLRREMRGDNKEQFHGIPVKVLHNYFLETTGKSPYEKITKSEAKDFLIEVESLC